MQQIVPFGLATLFSACDYFLAAAIIAIPKLLRSPYTHAADEIYARTSQLKNYFGFEGTDRFTKDHLEHARKYYVRDTGLDNNLNVFLRNITLEVENNFLYIINNFGI